MLHTTHTSPCPRPLIRAGLPSITGTPPASFRPSRVVMSALLAAGLLYIAPSAPAQAMGAAATPAIVHTAQTAQHAVQQKAAFPMARETSSTETVTAPVGDDTQRLVMAGGLAVALAGLLALILMMMNGTARTLGLRGGRD